MTIRTWLAKALDPQLGVLGERLTRLEEDYSAFKEATVRFRNKVGMRYARQGGLSDAWDDPAVLEALRKLKGGNSERNPFGPGYDAGEL